MPLLLFRKPAYKIVNILVLIIAVAGVTLEATGTPGFEITILVLLLWLFFNAIGVFRIRWNYYIDAINSITTRHKIIALTFDDGPHEQTSAILELLQQYNAMATFFLVGNKIEVMPEIVHELFNRGHIVGNHTFSHSAKFPGMKKVEMAEEIEKTSAILKSITGKEPKYFRPPFGITNPRIAKVTKQFNMKVVGWSVRSLDTVTKSAEKIINRVSKRIKPGSIILLHDYTPHALEVLEQILTDYSRKGYKFVTVEQLIELKKKE